jgi:Ferritin-like
LTTEPPIVIEDREELIFVLSEAAALEHMILCEYLFAAFSLKREVSEGVTAAQLEAIKRWERVVALVATQEMLHLALVSNLLT